MYIQRTIQNALIQYAKYFRGVLLVGPRQAGKTTLLKKTFPEYKYYNLNLPKTVLAIKQAPLEFLKSHKQPFILDEVQYYPHLLEYLLTYLDDPKTTKPVLLTGSSNLMLLEKVTQSLAGRIGILSLYPFTLNELNQARIEFKSINELILAGFYPEVILKKIPWSLYYDAYTQTYLTKDLRLFHNVLDLSKFEEFIALLAHRTGKIICYSEVSRILGISVNTVRQWTSLLSTLYIVKLIPAYSKLFTKQVARHPKIVFLDVGLASNLMFHDSLQPADLPFSPEYGQLFETLVTADYIKTAAHYNKKANLFYFRTKHGLEVDMVIKNGAQTFLIEIKTASEVHKRHLRTFSYLDKYFNNAQKILVYTGDAYTKINDVELWPFYNLPQLWNKILNV